MVRRDTGESVVEAFAVRGKKWEDRHPPKSLSHFRADKVVILTAAQWLGAISRAGKLNREVSP